MEISRNRTRIAIGVMLVGLGVALLLDTLIGDKSFLEDYWPIALIVFGLWQWVSKGFGPAVGPIIVSAVGVFLLVGNLTDIEIWDWWPAIVIVIGLAFVIRWSRHEKGQATTGELRRTDVFGGGDIKYDGGTFSGGQLTGLFGGGKVDLTGAKLPAEGATLDVTALFGGYEIRVPQDWRADIRATAIFGGATDERPAFSGTPSGTLVITGAVIFGGLSIKH